MVLCIAQATVVVAFHMVLTLFHLYEGPKVLQGIKKVRELSETDKNFFQCALAANVLVLIFSLLLLALGGFDRSRSALVITVKQLATVYMYNSVDKARINRLNEFTLPGMLFFCTDHRKHDLLDLAVCNLPWYTFSLAKLMALIVLVCKAKSKVSRGVLFMALAFLSLYIRTMKNLVSTSPQVKLFEDEEPMAVVVDCISLMLFVVLFRAGLNLFLEQSRRSLLSMLAIHLTPEVLVYIGLGTCNPPILVSLQYMDYCMDYISDTLICGFIDWLVKWVPCKELISRDKEKKPAKPQKPVGQQQPVAQQLVVLQQLVGQQQRGNGVRGRIGLNDLVRGEGRVLRSSSKARH
jgi:hypothetical protein